MSNTFFILAALLVATAAGQYLDPLGRFPKQQDGSSEFYNLPTRSLRRLLGHPLERSFIYGESLQVPAYLRDDIFDVSVLQLEDVIMHPLFPVYMGLPYFQQYWSNPMFQRYVGSQYFQRFWQVPAFQQYFVSPVLFYKYIYPLVTIFKYDTTTYGFPYTKQYSGGYPYFYPTRQLQATDNMEAYYKSLLEKMIYSMSQSTPVESSPRVNLKPEGAQEETIGNVVNTDTDDVLLTVGDAQIVDEAPISSETVDETTSTANAGTAEPQEIRRSNSNNDYNPAYYFNPLLHVLNGY